MIDMKGEGSADSQSMGIGVRLQDNKCTLVVCHRYLHCVFIIFLTTQACTYPGLIEALLPAVLLQKRARECGVVWTGKHLRTLAINEEDAHSQSMKRTHTRNQ